MKKNFLALSVAAALLAASTVVSAAVPDTFYMGARGGYASSDWDSNNNGFYSKDSGSGFGLGIFGGYSFNEYVSLELAYNYMDGFKAKNNLTGESDDIHVHGPEISGRLSLPLTANGTDIFLRGGAMYALASGDSKKLAPVVGVGVNFMLNDNFALRAGYDRYFSVYDEDENTKGIDFDADLVYLSFGYVFGKAPAPAPVQPVTQTVTSTYNLDANTTFGFDSAVLSQMGKDAISQMIMDVQNAQLSGTQYSVTGYTDRLGREEYNQRLSERRAQAVADELVARGVPASAISAAGLGSANPVTGNQCDGLARKDLIKCLAPDRRVVVNVLGTATTVEEVSVQQ